MGIVKSEEVNSKMQTKKKLTKYLERNSMLLLSQVMLLTACAEGIFSDGTLNTCPPLAFYSPQKQAEMYQAIVALPYNSPLRPTLNDYDKLRKEVKACWNAQ